MHLLGRYVPLAVVVVGIAVVYIANYLILKMIYGSPDLLHCKWRKRLLWGIGLLIPVSGIIILVLSSGVTIIALAGIFLQLLCKAAVSRLGALHQMPPPPKPPT